MSGFRELADAGYGIYVLELPVIRPMQGLMIGKGQRFTGELATAFDENQFNRYRVCFESGYDFRVCAGGRDGLWRWYWVVEQYPSDELHREAIWPRNWSASRNLL